MEVPEQRRHGEPVGQRTDHRGFGEGPHITDPVVVLLLPAGDEEDDRDDEEQRRGDELHLAQRPAPFEIGGRQGVHRGDATRGLPQPSGDDGPTAERSTDQTAAINSAMLGLVRNLRMMRSRVGPRLPIGRPLIELICR